MLNSLRPVYILTRREVRDQMRDWRIIAPIIILTLFFPYLMTFTAERAVGFVQDFGADIIGDRLIPFLLMVVGFFPISVSMVIALESFAGEKERGSIEPLLSSPLKDWQLYLGKLIAVMIPPLIASYLGIAVYLFSVYRSVNWVAPTDLLIQILVLTFVQALVMVSGAVIISTQTTSVRAANLLSSFIIIPVALLIQWESLIMFWGRYDALWWVVVAELIIAGLLIRTGVSHFNREELLGRELDVLNFRWMWHVVRDEFVGEATSIWNWYGKSILPSLRRLRLPFALMLASLVGGLLVGASQISAFPLPPELVDPEKLDQGFIATNLESVRIFSGLGILFIFVQNVRAYILAMLAGLFTYGVLGVLILMLPMFIIGYLTATVATAGINPFLFLTAFVVPHGIFEIPAIALAGALILRTGASLAASVRGESVSEGLLRSVTDWAKIFLAVVLPLMFAAAVVEALITPQFGVWLLSR
ncbi:MAG: hypothetical protein DWQ07_03710 [Chloroflexi bacterium]|nr:MAG: hypothetical protein DWQ07_03710 [Chloroflexota bacterium]MBL1193391.1 hypothetical protein [Chloroflexota bacterium]NOH10683.1 ABC transporter permease subunit [Chloroflexota bacterium]